jgi:hypothetical protein
MFDIYGQGRQQQPKKTPDFRQIAMGAISPSTPDTSSVGGTEIMTQARPETQGAGDILGGILGSIGKSLGGGGQEEEQYPEAPGWMPNQGVIGKQPFEAPRLPEMASGIGQSALL